MADETKQVLPAPLLLKRGTTEKVEAYAGPVGEIVIDTTKKTVSVQSGTAGGVYLVPETYALATDASSGLLINNSSIGFFTHSNAGIAIKLDYPNMIDSTAPGTLAVDETSGKLKTAFSLDYTPATGVLNVKGADGETTVATVNIPSSVSALTTAELLIASAESPVDGHDSGTFLHFAYTLSTGATSDIYVDVTTLIDIYTAGDESITVADNAISVNVKANSGLETTAQGLAAKVKADSGIGVGADGLEVVVDETKGLAVGTSGVGIELASAVDNTLQFDANGKLYAPAAAAVTVISADTGNVIQEGSDDGALLKLDSTTNNAIMVNANNELIVPLDCGEL